MQRNAVRNSQIFTTNAHDMSDVVKPGVYHRVVQGLLQSQSHWVLGGTVAHSPQNAPHVLNPINTHAVSANKLRNHAVSVPSVPSSRQLGATVWSGKWRPSPHFSS